MWNCHRTSENAGGGNPNDEKYVGAIGVRSMSSINFLSPRVVPRVISNTTPEAICRLASSLLDEKCRGGLFPNEAEHATCDEMASTLLSHALEGVDLFATPAAPTKGNKPVQLFVCVCALLRNELLTERLVDRLLSNPNPSPAQIETLLPLVPDFTSEFDDNLPDATPTPLAAVTRFLRTMTPHVLEELGRKTKHAYEVWHIARIADGLGVEFMQQAYVSTPFSRQTVLLTGIPTSCYSSVDSVTQQHPWSLTTYSSIIKALEQFDADPDPGFRRISARPLINTLLQSMVHRCESPTGETTELALKACYQAGNQALCSAIVAKTMVNGTFAPDLANDLPVLVVISHHHTGPICDTLSMYIKSVVLAWAKEIRESSSPTRLKASHPNPKKDPMERLRNTIQCTCGRCRSILDFLTSSTEERLLLPQVDAHDISHLRQALGNAGANQIAQWRELRTAGRSSFDVGSCLSLLNAHRAHQLSLNHALPDRSQRNSKTRRCSASSSSNSFAQTRPQSSYCLEPTTTNRSWLSSEYRRYISLS